jgi:hypothetical protein
VDLVGVLDDERGLLIMPFTDSKGGELAKERILKELMSDFFEIKGIPMTVEINPYLCSVDYNQEPLSLNDFVKAIRRNSRG